MILDEADRMLDMGFGPEVRKIVEENGMPSKEDRQTLMFSATFPEDIQRLARDFLNNYLFVTVGRVGSANTDIKQTVHCVSQYDKREKLVEILNESGRQTNRGSIRYHLNKINATQGIHMHCIGPYRASTPDLKGFDKFKAFLIKDIKISLRQRS